MVVMVSRIDILREIIEREFDYKLLEWKDFNERGKSRPKVERLSDNKVSQDIEVELRDDNTIRVKDYLTDNFGYYNLDTGEQDFEFETKNQTSLDIKPSEEYKERMMTVNTAAKVLNLEKHEIFKKKNIQPISGYRLKCPMSAIFSTDNSAVKDAVFVDFTNKDGERVGTQVLDGKSKMSVTGSSFREAYHTIQEGYKEAFQFYKVGVVVESYTTALEIAEAIPSAFVACSAGQSNLIGVFHTLKEKHGDTFFILTLDKNKLFNKDNPKYKAVEDLIKASQDDEIPFIIPDSGDPRLVECTDFNDMAKVLGKELCHQIIYSEVMMLTPIPPKIIDDSGNSFGVISGLNNRYTRVFYKTIYSNTQILASNAYWKLIPEDCEDTIHRKFISKAIQDSTTKTCGIGVYLEGGNVILNCKGYRILYDGKKYMRCRSPAPISNRYIDVPGSVSSSHTKTILDTNNRIDLQPLINVYEKLFSADKSMLFLYLGWAIQAAYAQILNRRVHLWVTGKSGSGKSKICNGIVSWILNPISRSFDNKTVASIVADAIKSGVDESPVLYFDEVGGETGHKAKMVADLLEVIKGAATKDDTVESGRSSSDLTARNFKTRFGVALSSPVAKFNDVQDRTRFIVMKEQGNIKHKPEQLYKDFKQECCDISNDFMYMLARYAHSIERRVELAVDVVNNDKNTPATSGHQDVTNAYILAATSIIISEYTGIDDLQESIEHTYEVIKTMLYDNFASSKEFEDDNKDVGYNLFFTKVINGPLQTPLWQYLLNDATRRDMADELGLSIITGVPTGMAKHSLGGYFFRISGSKKRLIEYLKNTRQVINPYNGFEYELFDSSKDTVIETRDRITGVLTRVCYIKIPEHLSHRIEEYKEANEITK